MTHQSATTFQWLAPEQFNHVKAFYKQYMKQAMPNSKERIAVLTEQQAIVAAVKLRRLGQYSFVTGLIVQPEKQGQGLGHQLMAAITPQLIAHQCFIFAVSDLQRFYQQHHFSLCLHAPNEIKQQFLKYQAKQADLQLLQYQP